MDDEVPSARPRIEPYVVQGAVNEPITLLTGDFTLRAGNAEVELLDGRVSYELLGSKGVMFEGTTPAGMQPLLAEEGQLSGECEGDPFEWPVYITSSSTSLIGGRPGNVRGRLRAPVSVGDSEFASLRFCLGNLGSSWGGRMDLPLPGGVCFVDPIPEVAQLAEQARAERGHVITHVGRWEPASGRIDEKAAKDTLELLRLWFGFVRGAWSGPLFPQGLNDDTIAWRQFADWRLVASGLPGANWHPPTPVDLTPAFNRFASLRENPTWGEPLKLTVSWLVEAGSKGVVTELKIVMALVALEMLAWVHVVESERLHSEDDFKTISLAGKIRALLSLLEIPLSTPDQLAGIPGVPAREVFDGPGLVAWVRNNIVHATAKNRAKLNALNEGLVLHHCGQLAIEYLELALLAVLRHEGRYWSRTEKRFLPVPRRSG